MSKQVKDWLWQEACEMEGNKENARCASNFYKKFQEIYYKDREFPSIQDVLELLDTINRSECSQYTLLCDGNGDFEIIVDGVESPLDGMSDLEGCHEYLSDLLARITGDTE